MPQNTELLKTARPSIIVGGDLQPSLGAGLRFLLIHEHVDGLYRCEAAFGNIGDESGGMGYLYFDRRVLDFGTSLRVKIGQDVLFDGKITALEADFPEASPPGIAVLAEDRFQNLRMTRRTRTFEHMSDSAVFNQIASDHGCSACADLADDLTHAVLAQVNQSDLAFMRERARSIDAELWIDGTVIHVCAHTRRKTQPVTLTYQKTLREFTVIADTANQYSTVTVCGWDKASKAALTCDASSSVVAGEVGAGNGGASIASTAVGRRTQIIAHRFPENQQEAKAEAESAYKTMARSFVTGRGVAETDAALKAGATLDLQGLGPLFSGSYYVIALCHRYDPIRGLRTEITVNRPFIGQ